MKDKKIFISKALKAGSLFSLLLIGIVVGSVFMLQMQEVVLHQRSSWVAMAEANPGTGASGYLEFFIYPHAAVPGTTYGVNCSEATAYEYRDTNSGEMTKNTPYNTAFDFVVKYRLNSSDGYNNSALAWTLNWSYVVMACNFNWTADITTSTMTDVLVAYNANYEWIQCYLNNGGAGYSISKNEKFSWNTSGWILR